ncbi:MAG: hypothetical protein IPK80_03150 [Nannocystis sp.]|nr:hypothetical protein [Nannocystis sp.]
MFPYLGFTSSPPRALSLILALALGGCAGGPDDDTGASSSSSSSSTGSESASSTSTASTSGSSTSDSGTTTEAMTSSTSAASDPSTSAGSSSTGVETGGPGSCGADACGRGEYCDWTGNTCGLSRSDEGACAPTADACDDVYAPVCGCDGEVYSNTCYAAAAGVDINNEGGCLPPDGYFACGSSFCDVATTYCEVQVSDVFPLPDIYTCKQLPEACSKEQVCGCLEGEPCFEFGCEENDGELTVLCPGG